MTDKEAMQMALDALTIFREWEMGQDYNSNRETVLARAFKAEEALRARLEQGEQKNMNEPRQGWHLREVWFEDGEPTIHREPAKPEPVAWMRSNKTHITFHRQPEYLPLYTAPPKREWQGLTDEEIKSTASLGIYEKPLIDFARAIEAKLKEKNT